MWRFAEEERWKTVSKVWTLEWQEWVEEWGACQCQARQAGGECSAAYGTDQFFVGMDRVIKIWTGAKLKNSVLYAQVSLKVGSTFVYGFGRRWKIWRWGKDQHSVIGSGFLQAWVVWKYFGKAQTDKYSCGKDTG